MEPLGPLDDDARELLAEYRNARPGGESRARNWSAVRARVQPPAPARASHRTWWIGAAVFAMAAAIFVLARGWLGAWQADADTRARPPAASDVRNAPASDSVVVPRAPAPAIVPALPPVSTPAPAAEVPLQRSRAQGSVRAEADAPRVADDARAELELIAAARQSLVEHDFARALSLLDDHARRFPEGVLGEERLALRAIALCRSHAEGADAAVRAFESSHPRSHHHRSITQACATAGNPTSP